MKSPSEDYTVEEIIGEIGRRSSQSWSTSDKDTIREIARQLDIERFRVPYDDKNHARSICDSMWLNPGFLLLTDDAKAQVDVRGIRASEEPSYGRHRWRLDFTTYVAAGASKLGKTPTRPLCECGIPRNSDGDCEFGAC